MNKLIKLAVVPALALGVLAIGGGIASAHHFDASTRCDTETGETIVSLNIVYPSGTATLNGESLPLNTELERRITSDATLVIDGPGTEYDLSTTVAAISDCVDSTTTTTTPPEPNTTTTTPPEPNTVDAVSITSMDCGAIPTVSIAGNGEPASVMVGGIVWYNDGTPPSFWGVDLTGYIVNHGDGTFTVEAQGTAQTTTDHVSMLARVTFADGEVIETPGVDYQVNNDCGTPTTAPPAMTDPPTTGPPVDPPATTTTPTPTTEPVDPPPPSSLPASPLTPGELPATR